MTMLSTIIDIVRRRNAHEETHPAPTYTDRQIREAAELLPPNARGIGPVTFSQAILAAQETERPDLDRLCLDLGIEIDHRPMACGTCGWIEADGDGYAFMVNSDHRSTRRRFTTAHMIGHWIFHGDILRKGGGTNEDLSYRQIRDAPRFNPYMEERFESQASRYAVGIVMPADIVVRLRDEGLSVFQIADRLDVTPQQMAIRLRTLQNRRGTRR